MAEEMMRPPINRSMLKLDRSFFRRSVPLKAARIFDNKNISKVRTQLERSKDALAQPRITNILADPDRSLAAQGRKCILLREEVAHSNDNTRTTGPHTSVLESLATEGLLEVIPYDLQLEYDYWTYHDIISAILPEDDLGEIPSGFTQTGHVAHLNLRDDYLKYKYLIAEIMMDKNPGITTVINKIDDVGEESAYRTFQYELLAGKNDLNVTISEENCTFQFDFSKVYWNSRLNTEHRRLVTLFNAGDVVCDVMAGIGPFAVPAGKKGVFVWANDLNPDSYIYLKDAITRNKVHQYVQPFNDDGHTFIRSASEALLKTEHSVDIMSKPARATQKKPELLKTIHQPRVFQHFVMNLPASALSFLPDFIGLYSGLEDQLPSDSQMPQIHVYCFNTKSDDNVEETKKICAEISSLLGYNLLPGKIEDGGVEIHDVRDVAPKKRMFCASFRLPQEVAFRRR
ncbi:hypothetical protein AMS68_002413 [Peltaster fructicola]|uniref:tRNA (guanine(37)-N1)-methyltransferase n=1 Tax=Peltaster fructicola TaxID=286661 RepID=A0A6H0XQC9_9PEZI|nr:hypothetical protein AMS68_002413 [Peltaster fructicola]